jgi:hypothetical protein
LCFTARSGSFGSGGGGLEGKLGPFCLEGNKLYVDTGDLIESVVGRFVVTTIGVVSLKIAVDGAIGDDPAEVPGVAEDSDPLVSVLW